ncbi:MAG: enoyl-CoA hydratase [bacterium]|nr:enoyl-CoA hydratase [bacterium]
MSSVINFYRENSVAIVSIEEREFKNTFSKRLISGLMETVEDINNDPSIKVVVIHGYDNYFCCGGTKEELIDILEGNLKFSDLNFYDLLLKCKVPVIAAMQGHALGGGLVFGSYADIIVMGKECIYNTNFMKYGFTPGMGATYIIQKKFGEILGTEMLYSAKNYYGGELQERGVSAKVVPKKDVISTAMALARELEEKPLLSLKTLKEQLTARIKSELPEIIEQELQMHNITFAQPEVRTRIESLFGN